MSIWDGRSSFYQATLHKEPMVIDGEARDITPEVDVKALARSVLDKPDEDWTFIDPEDVKRLARAVLERD